jgi:hypothetical protein
MPFGKNLVGYSQKSAPELSLLREVRVALVTISASTHASWHRMGVSWLAEKMTPISLDWVVEQCPSF